MWNKIRSSFRNSVTILWARVQVLAGLTAASLMALASDPNVTGAIQSALQPKFISYYVIAVGLITEIARRRTAGELKVDVFCVLSWLGNLFGGPFAKAAVDAYRAKLAAENTSEKIAADLAACELSVEQRERELAAEMLVGEHGRWYTALPRPLFAAAFIIYIWKMMRLGQGPGPRHDRCTLRRYVAMGDGGGHRIFRWTHS